MLGEEKMVEETEEEEDEKDGLEYVTDTPLGGSYMTPPSTGGWSSPSPAPSRLPTPGDSDPENNAVLHTEELEACIKAFLEEVEEDIEMNDLPPLENTSPLPVLVLVFPSFVPFAMSTSQCCVRATLPPSTLFADRALLCREYSISAPNTLVETVSKYKGLY